MNLFEGSIRRRDGRWIFSSAALGDCALPGSIAREEKSSVELAFRPHSIELDGGTHTGLELEGSIEGGEFLGEFMRYEVRVNEAIVIADQSHRRGLERRPVGTRVRLSVPPDEIRII